MSQRRITRGNGAWVSIAMLAAIVMIGSQTSARAEQWESLFDGKTLKGWDGNPDFWRVEDGAITGETTKEKPTRGNTFIIWRGGTLEDFELKVEYRIFAHNSGIQYRSFEIPGQKWVVGGYQADIDVANRFSGCCYGEKFRGMLCPRGMKTVIGPNHKFKVVGKLGDPAELAKAIKPAGQWNEYHIIAKGFHFVQKINGTVMADVTDEDVEQRRRSGILAFQLHAGPPMKVQFRNIRLKRLSSGGAEATSDSRKDGSSSQSAVPTAAKAPQKKKIVFIAGPRSHGFAAHEHKAGCMLLAKAINENVPQAEAVVVTNGWPKDSSILDDAASIVVYSDGGGRHPLLGHLDEVDALMKKGVGLACIHYAVEVPKGPAGEKFLEWIGGYFETNWSVNPHWTANFRKLPEHPITNGVRPFAINDEWYYHMRFRKGLEGITPILSDLPPASTLNRPDGPHSNNPHVREAVLKRKEPQHVAWAYQRPNGGRGFGFTGGHVHWNWGHNDFRTLVLNAIVWTAHIDVPAGGVPSTPPSVDDLLANQDEPVPKNFDRRRIKQMLREWNAGDAKTGAVTDDGDVIVVRRGKKKRAVEIDPQAIRFRSPVVTPRTPGHRVQVRADIRGARELVLVVTDGGNGYACDWADWGEPVLTGPNGSVPLTTLKWTTATSDWGRVQVGRNAGGGPLRIGGTALKDGIGTHANSLIVFPLPQGHSFTEFRAVAGLDEGGTSQGGCGQQSSVQFFVATDAATARRLLARSAGSGASHDPEEAVAALDVHEGLQVTLSASEPYIRSLTNLDIDHRGRIWVCEVVNYRHNNGKRPEGDRILILTDEDHDGVIDRIETYYQGRDVDSAMGICVLGNRVIVSASPNVIVFTDEDGDDRPDRKEYLFTNTGQPQHDHSVHSFVFGPDGKLYFNFGNTGRAVHDKHGKPVVDLAGNVVVDNGKPYFGGMVFRCDMDGSNFEVLAHNFRNNYEVAVDSFGTLWQSDNDDDGNRGVRINYVMEYGNYGYRDEMTGAGWRTPRIGMHPEIPRRHWHQNDPGVVPNLLQTGAGSPTGITVYEGRTLPQVFWDQIIHCDAGPNVVRSYVTQPSGAGYVARIVDLVVGARDKWFRPADVCVAPDGSLFITDWYDPGVGGHRQGDIERGRLFRVAPPRKPYAVPRYDLQTIDGAIAALRSPNQAVRYLAWQKLHAEGARAEPALKAVFDTDTNPRQRARALWLLGKIPGRGEAHVRAALADRDPDIRIVGIRLARQLGLPLEPIVAAVVRDPVPRVRRDAAIALRFLRSERADALWAELAEQYDGDRWYLEALGIGADLSWDTRLAALLDRVGSRWRTAPFRDIVWRSRSSRTPQLLAEILADHSLRETDVPRFIRAFDFQQSPQKNEALLRLAFQTDYPNAQRRTLVVTEALKRVQGVDLGKNERYRAALERLLDQLRGRPDFIELVQRFRVTDRYPELLELARQHPQDDLGVAAMQTLLSLGQIELIERSLHGDPEQAARTLQALATTADPRANRLLATFLRDDTRPLVLRRLAVRALGANRGGALTLVRMAEGGRLPAELKETAAAVLHGASWSDVKQQAARLFPLPPAKDARPLPPLTELAKRRGNPERGRRIFFGDGTCAKCHKVRGEGKDVGPDLSEIGSKLSRLALLGSIVYPSAAISHNYETYTLALASGNVVSGILASETADAVTIKTKDGITRTFPRDEIEAIKKENVSLMPADLQKTMTAEDLVDVVEFLTTLTKAANRAAAMN